MSGYVIKADVPDLRRNGSAFLASKQVFPKACGYLEDVT